MAKKTTTKRPAAKPTRIPLKHPMHKGIARVWKKDLEAWLAKGWTKVDPVENADS